jgi:HPt (histidine-containing phosphotransfer) domain-containing protein
MSSETQHTDFTFLKSFTQGNHDRMVKYIGSFLAMAPEKISQMKKALDEKNWSDLRTAAHSLKPQLAYMGINSIKEDILAIEENAGEEKNLDQLPALVSKVETVCTAAFVELNDFVKSVS